MRRLSLALLAALSTAPAAQAADLPAPLPAPAAWSMSVFGGASWFDSVDARGALGTVDIEFDTGFLVGGALGYTPLDWLRTEIEVAYTSADADLTLLVVPEGGDLGALSVMGNAWLGFNMLPVVGGTVNDIGAGMGFSPYFGGGLGVGFLSAESEGFDLDDDATAFAWQVGAGVRWTFASTIGLDVGYRYRNFVDVEFDGLDPFDLASHNVVAGLTFSF